MGVLTFMAAMSVLPGVPWESSPLESEPGRELMGMVLVAAWMGLLTWWWRRAEAQIPPPINP
jgi:hypothetical protein